ncbi:MAG: hypothetical protein KC457_05885, partial [Myxococcales bacterium]|nr:hypothetical protein [Myxococcales bacterium]
ERMPVPVARRVELSALLYMPPKLEELGERLAALGREGADAVLQEIGPLVQASARGDEEREVFMRLALSAGVPAERAAALLAL